MTFEEAHQCLHPVEGLPVVGDAVASFNPIYGQGMSSAVQQAEALATLLGEGRDRRDLTRRHARAARAVADVPWRVATGADFLYAATQGRRPPGTDAGDDGRAARSQALIQQQACRSEMIHKRVEDAIPARKAHIFKRGDSRFGIIGCRLRIINRAGRDIDARQR